MSSSERWGWQPSWYYPPSFGGLCEGARSSGVTLIIGGQNGGTGPIAQASGAYKNTPYKIEWTNESTSTGEMSALESGAINLGGGGDLSLIFLQANQVPAWSKSSIPLTLVGISRGASSGCQEVSAFRGSCAQGFRYHQPGGFER